MISNTTPTTLGAITTKIGSGATPRGGSHVYQPSGTAFIRSQNVYDNRFDVGGLVFIDDKAAAALRNVTVEAGDVLLNITGDSVARCCLVPESVLPARVSQHVMIIRPDKLQLDSRYLQSWLTNPGTKQQLLVRASAGATRPALTKDHVGSLMLTLPNMTEQRAIASVLGALDEKVEANQRQSQVLINVALAIFNDWFVEFGPVQNKMTNGVPYLAPDLLALFPSRVDDEGKPIGWSERCFGELLSDSLGGDWGKEVPDEEHSQAVCIIRGTDLPNIALGTIGKVPTRYTTPKRANQRALADGDIVVEISGGSPTQPTGRSLFITDSILDRFPHPVVCASFCRRFRPSNPQNGILAALHLYNLYLGGGTWSYQNQSTGIANFQTTRFLEKEKIVWPGDDLVNEFARVVQPIIHLVSRNESLALTNLRDALLPNLMSGYLSVRDVESMVESLV
jgi:type I restriction enzyme S subunit